MSTVDDQPLPIDTALPELTAALRANNAAVLVAPPGAGKTTRVPLILAGEDWAKDRRILVLEPRRLAARAAVNLTVSYVPGLAAVANAVTRNRQGVSRPS